MKKTIFYFTLLGLVTLTSCKEKATEKIQSNKVEAATSVSAQAENAAVMTFDKTFHDFGQIKQMQPQETVFTFTNTGNAPLVITNASSSCGCTIPEYPRNTPIAPGESGQLTVKFNGSGLNKVTKTIRVEANTAKGVETLQIQATVLAN